MRPWHRLARWVSVPIFGVVLFLVVSPRQGKPSSIALAADVLQSPDESISLDASDTLALTSLQSKFQDIARQVAPTVVAISAIDSDIEADDLFYARDLTPRKLQDFLEKNTRTVGTGFIINAQGYILTNEHVIEDSSRLWITTDDHRVYPAIVIGADPRADLAVLRIPATRLPVAHFSRAEGYQRGQWAITLGNPYGLATEGEMALSVGVISAVDRSLPRLASKENRLYSNLIQTTAQINPGNSGGPLFDIRGDVIGVNAAVILPQKQTNGIGFAIPVTPRFLDEVNELEQGREVIYGYVGVTVTPATPDERGDQDAARNAGVCIETVEKDSPADQAGLKPGDIILAINNQSIGNTDQFIRRVGEARVNAPRAFEFVRGQVHLTATLTPIKRPVPYAVFSENQRMHWRGMVLGPIPEGWAGRSTGPADLRGLLVIEIAGQSPLRRQGISPGSILTSVAGRPVQTLADLQNVLDAVPLDQCSIEARSAMPTPVAAVQK